MYKVNPVKATCLKFNGKADALQGMNDTCFDICAGFSGTSDVYEVDQQCAQSCTDFIEAKKKEILGVDSCDHQVPYRPAIWNQVPHFVPALLRKGLSPEEALQKGLELCNKKPLLLAECREKCQTDYNAIEPYDDSQPLVPKIAKSQKDVQESEKEERHNHIAFILLILAIILGYMMISVK